MKYLFIWILICFFSLLPLTAVAETLYGTATLSSWGSTLDIATNETGDGYDFANLDTNIDVVVTSESCLTKRANLEKTAIWSCVVLLGLAKPTYFSEQYIDSADFSVPLELTDTTLFKRIDSTTFLNNDYDSSFDWVDLTTLHSEIDYYARTSRFFVTFLPSENGYAIFRFTDFFGRNTGTYIILDSMRIEWYLQTDGTTQFDLSVTIINPRVNRNNTALSNSSQAVFDILGRRRPSQKQANLLYIQKNGLNTKKLEFSFSR